MQTTSQLIESDTEHLIHPLHHPSFQRAPRIWVKGQGALIYDADGNELIDGLAGLWNVNVGHGRRELAQAAYDQMSTLAYHTAYSGGSNLPAIQLAEKLSELAYPQINTFFFTSGGAESSESSFKTARFYWRAQGRPDKVKIISRLRAYHGLTMAAMSATGMPPFWTMFEPRVPNFSHIESPYPYRFNNPDPSVSPGIAAANLLEQKILQEGPETVAAFIAEPIQGAGGVIVPPPDYFPRIREICDQYDVLFISDEVITGFGRTGKWFGLEHYRAASGAIIQPDIMQFAKGITSGYVPLGGIGVSDKVMRVMNSVPPSQRWMHAFTYSAHPTSCAVALANLKILQEENLVERAAVQGEKLQAKLREMQELEGVGDVRGLGLIGAVELVADKATKATYPADRQLNQRGMDMLLANGLYTRVLFDAIAFAPPLIISDEQLDRMVEIVRKTIPQLLDAVSG
ncbi:MAG: aspartate aminotransferase family protein [Chloroflexi bacterium]|nr:aspartate aminotransferase family protein [Chloroflexota bacterium]